MELEVRVKYYWRVNENDAARVATGWDENSRDRFLWSRLLGVAEQLQVFDVGEKAGGELRAG